jgi:hypothetical protein
MDLGLGYEPGFGALTWVYEKARVEEDEAELDLGASFGGVAEEALALRLKELGRQSLRTSSESEPLSHASSQSVVEAEVKWEECTAM